jgi:hypothetical protein
MQALAIRMRVFLQLAWTDSIGMSSGQNPKIAIAVESRPCAQNAQGWGTHPRELD